MRPFYRMIPYAATLLCVFGAVTRAAPNVAGVFNAASWVPTGMPNSSIAQGSIFVVTGTGMGPATIQHANTYPLPTSQGLAGTTIQVTVGGVTNSCIMLYSVGTQVAAILPSSTPVGNGTLTVSYQGSQGTLPIQVIQRSFGIFAVNEQGSGPGVITNAGYQLRVPTDAAHPGDVLIIWGTGLGPITADETIAPPQTDLNTGAQVFVGGQAAHVLYGGRGSSAGLDQINFTVPNGLSGCFVSVTVKVAGVVSNFATIPVAPAGQDFCSQPGGLSTANFKKVQNGGSLNLAQLNLNTIAGNYAVAGFGQWDFANLIASHGGGTPSIGSCTVYNVASGHGVVITDPFSVPGLDAGTQLNLKGPNGTKTISLISNGAYGSELSSETQSPYLVPGTYTIDNGSGGKDIGPFTATLTIPQPITWTNKDSIQNISGTQDLQITWSGGDPDDIVSIIGINGLPSIHMDAEFFCTAQASAGQFTVPSQVLALLPPAGFDAQGTPGADLIVGLVPSLAQSLFTAPNLDWGVFYSYTTSARTVSVQ